MARNAHLELMNEKMRRDKYGASSECGKRLPTDVLARIADLPQARLHELLPWNWKALQETEQQIMAA